MTNCKKRRLWVEAESTAAPLSSSEKLKELISFSIQHGCQELMVQVYRRGLRWYPSAHGPSASVVTETFDPLRELIQAATIADIKIHAWINVFNLGTQPSPWALAAFERDAFLSDSSGTSLLDYVDFETPPDAQRKNHFKIDAPGLWLDPAHPHAQDHVQSVLSEIVTHYPELAGIHLDFIRYPYLIPTRPWSGSDCGDDFGYGIHARQRWSAESGASSLKTTIAGKYVLSTPSEALGWDQFRRSQVEKVIIRAKKLLNKHQELSIAGLAWPDRAYLSAFQDWRGWMQRGLLDALCLMSYTEDLTLFDYLQTQAMAFTSSACKLVSGIGTYKLNNAEELLAQENAAQKRGVSEVILFSYGWLKNHPELLRV